MSDEQSPKIVPNVRTLSADDLGIAQDDPRWAATVEEALGIESDQPTGDPIVKVITDKLYGDNDDSPVSAPTDRTVTGSQIGDVLYAWQMRVDDGWNIISLTMSGDRVMPLVTTSLAMAWEAFEVAQAHANRFQCQVRLATFAFSALAAVVEPND